MTKPWIFGWLLLLGAALATPASTSGCGGDQLGLRPPYLAASTDIIDFGDVGVGDEEQRTLYVINKGEQLLTLQDPEGDTQGGIFAVLLAGSAVEPAQDLVVRIVFVPADTLDYETTVLFPNNSNNESQLRVTLRGRGVYSDPCYGTVCQTPPSPCFQGLGECMQGACVYPPNDGVGCDDDNLCTLADTCSLGTCSGQARRCEAPPPDGCINSATLRRYEAIGTCMPQSGDCDYDYQDISCQFGCAGAICNGDPCAGGCDDGNPCTIDSCSAVTGCEHRANDGAGCTAPSGQCPAGVCVGTQCMSRSGEVCTATVDIDLCGEVDMAGVCTATGVCEVDEPPPEYLCSDCLGVCLTCTIIPGVQFEYKWCW